MGSVCLAVLALALLGGCGSGGAAATPAGGPGSLSAASVGEQSWAEEVLVLTNEIRAEHGLEPLILDRTASIAAYAHSWDMHVRGFFAHVNPDGDGPRERLAQHGVVYEYAGENLARGHTTPEEVVQGWMESENHRANILYWGWTHVGIAVHSGPSEGPWWTQEFYR